jgi:hypothetical protein
MVKDCKRCAAIGLAVCACVISGEIVRATDAEAVEQRRFAAKMDDSPHTENEIKAPQQMGLIGIRPGYTATIDFTPLWSTYLPPKK